MTPESKLTAVVAASGTMAAAAAVGTPTQWLWVLAGAASGAAMATSLHDAERSVLRSMWAYVVDMMCALVFAFVALPYAQAALATAHAEAIVATEHVLMAVAAVLAAFGRFGLRLARDLVVARGRAMAERSQPPKTPGDSP